MQRPCRKVCLNITIFNFNTRLHETKVEKEFYKDKYFSQQNENEKLKVECMGPPPSSASIAPSIMTPAVDQLQLQRKIYIFFTFKL